MTPPAPPDPVPPDPVPPDPALPDSGPPPAGLHPIGEVAARSSTPITTLRYYEKRGLIDAPERVGGQRRYRPEVLIRLMVIRFCRIAGLDLDAIAAVVNDTSDGRKVTREIASRHLLTIDAQLERLTMARALMEAAVACRCDSVERCTCGAVAPVVAAYGPQLSELGY